MATDHVARLGEVGITGIMRILTKLIIVLVAVLGLSFTAASVISEHQAGAQAAGPAITIKDFQYNPADLAVKVGQKVTVTNNDTTPHTVTARDGSFNVDVPPNGNATLTVAKAGSFPYYCTYHPNEHNPATIKAS
jgi:plastocyanin